MIRYSQSTELEKDGLGQKQWGHTSGRRKEGEGTVKHLLEKEKDRIVKGIESPVEEFELFFMKAKAH